MKYIFEANTFQEWKRRIVHVLSTSKFTATPNSSSVCFANWNSDRSMDYINYCKTLINAFYGSGMTYADTDSIKMYKNKMNKGVQNMVTIVYKNWKYNSMVLDVEFVPNDKATNGYFNQRCKEEGWQLVYVKPVEERNTKYVYVRQR